MLAQPQPGTDFGWSGLTNVSAGLIVPHCFLWVPAPFKRAPIRRGREKQRERKEANRGKMIQLSANLQPVYQTDGVDGFAAAWPPSRWVFWKWWAVCPSNSRPRSLHRTYVDYNLIRLLLLQESERVHPSPPALKRSCWDKNKEKKLQTLVALEWEG